MSHYLEAKEMLSDPRVGLFLRELLHDVFKEGYTFQDPQYPDTRPGVEIFIVNLTSTKSILFDAAMRIMKVDVSRPCGVTRQIVGAFRAEIRELKRILIDASGIKPIEDKNISVRD